MIRPARGDDVQQICTIYNHYVENTTVTFEEKPVEAPEMEKRIETITTALPWLVMEEEGRVLGFAYAAGWKSRSAYRHTVETSVYVNKDDVGKGIGTALYVRLLAELAHRNIHAVIGCIALPNMKSQRLHEKLGFVNAGYFSAVGYKFERWIDVGYWELLLKKQS